MNKYIACLWKATDLPSYSGDSYDVGYVANLHRNILNHDPKGELVMFVDQQHEVLIQMLGIETIRFTELDCGGWSKVLEIFHPDRRPPWGERYVAVGLDTVMWGDPSWLFEWNESDVGIPLDPYQPDGIPCDAVISFDAQGADRVWGWYQRALRDNKMANFLFANRPSEMMLLRSLFRFYKWKPLEAVPTKLLSYKAHVMNGADKSLADIIYFHGVPKPHQLPDTDPVKQEWLR